MGALRPRATTKVDSWSPGRRAGGRVADENSICPSFGKGAALRKAQSGHGGAIKVRSALTRAAAPIIPTPPTRRVANPRPLGDSSTVEQRTLTPLILVRIQVPQPSFPVSVARCATVRCRPDRVHRERARIGAIVYREILPGDVAGLVAARERAGGAGLVDERRNVCAPAQIGRRWRIPEGNP